MQSTITRDRVVYPLDLTEAELIEWLRFFESMRQVECGVRETINTRSS